MFLQATLEGYTKVCCGFFLSAVAKAENDHLPVKFRGIVMHLAFQAVMLRPFGEVFARVACNFPEWRIFESESLSVLSLHYQPWLNLQLR